MTDQWGRFASRAPQMLEDLGFEDNVAVFIPQEQEIAGGGFETTYPDEPDITVAGEVVPPGADPQVQPGGTLAEKDLMVYLDDGHNIDFTEYGESGDSAARLAIDGYDDDYRVQEENNQLDGYIQLGCVEI